MIKRFSKKTLSLVLALVLVATTFFIFDPDLLRVDSDAYANVETVQQATPLSAQTVYAPETIYLKPGTENFQYITNYDYNSGTVSSAKDTSGNIYFKNDDATEVTVAVNRVYAKGSTTSVAANTLKVNSTTVAAYAGLTNGADADANTKFSAATVVASTSSGTLTHSITAGSFSGHADRTVEGIYFIEWVIRYKIDDVYHYTFAYTGIYSTSLAQAGITYNGKRTSSFANPYQMGYTFITGAMRYGGGNAKSNFTNSSYINVSGGVGSNTTLTAPLVSFVGCANNSSNYTVPGNNLVANMQTSTTYFPSAANGGVYRIPDGHQRVNEFASFHTTYWSDFGSYDDPTPVGSSHDIGTVYSDGSSTGVAYIVADTSRYTNYNQIPYLSAGWAQFQHHRDGNGNKLEQITGKAPNNNDPTDLSDPVTTNVNTGNWETGEDDDGRSFTRGLYAFNGNIRSGMVSVYFYMSNGYSGMGTASVNVRTNVGLHTTTTNKTVIRQQYNTAQNSFIDAYNVAEHSSKDYASYYNMMKTAAQEICDPTAHSRSSYTELATYVKECVDEINSDFGSDVLFYVPEAIYTAPSGTYGQIPTLSAAVYVNNTVNTDGSYAKATGESLTGEIYFSYNYAENATLSYEFVSPTWTEFHNDTNDSFDAGNITISNDAAGTGATAIKPSTSTKTSHAKSVSITSGSKKHMTNGQFLFDSGGGGINETGYWIRWTVTYTDSLDGRTKTAQAYSYIYKTFYLPVVAETEQVNEDTANSYAKSFTWMSGIHGVSSTAGSGTAYYTRTTTNHYNIPYSYSVKVGSSVQLTDHDAEGTYGTDLYRYAFDSSDTSKYFYTSPNNEGTTAWSNSSRDNTAYYPESVPANSSQYHLSGDENNTVVGVNSPHAFMSVDTSRYTNLNQVPGFSVGMMVTSDESSTGGSWYMSNFTPVLDAGNSNYTGGDNSSSSTLRENIYGANGSGLQGTVFAGYASYSFVGGYEYDGVKYNGKGNFPLTTSAASKTYAVKGCYSNEDTGFTAGQWADDNEKLLNTGVCYVDVTQYNKQPLRDAVMYAISKSAMLDKNVYDTSHADWTAYTSAFETAYKALTQVDGINGVTDIQATADALTNAVNSLIAVDDNGEWTSPARLKGTLKVYHVVADVDSDGNLTNISRIAIDTADGTADGIETEEYFYGDNIYTGYEDAEGYNYFGYYRSTTTSDRWRGAEELTGGDIAAQGTYGESGHNTDEYYCGSTLTYTYVYTRATAGVYMDLGDADHAFENATNLADLSKATINPAFEEDGTLGGMATYTVGQDNTSFDFTVTKLGYNTATPVGSFKNLFNFNLMSWSAANGTITAVDTNRQTVTFTANNSDGDADGDGVDDDGTVDGYTNWQNNTGSVGGLTPGHEYMIVYDYEVLTAGDTKLAPFWFTGTTSAVTDWSGSGNYGATYKTVAGYSSGSHSYTFTMPTGRTYAIFRLGVQTPNASVKFSNIRFVDLDDSTQYAKMNDIFIENAATGLKAGQTYTVSFESTLTYDELRWYAQDMYSSFSPAEDWSHDQGTIQLFITATSGNDKLANYTVPVEVKTDISNGGTIGTFTVPAGCSNINLGFCITSNQYISGRVENIRIAEGDFVETDHNGKTYNVPDPEWEGYTFVGWTEDDAPFDGVLGSHDASTSTTPYTYGMDDDTILANWKINKYDVTFDNEFDFDQGWEYLDTAKGALSVDTDANSLTLQTLSTATSADNSIVNKDIMTLTPGHRYRLTIDYQQNTVVSGVQTQVHMFYYDTEAKAQSNSWVGFYDNTAGNANFDYITGNVYTSIAESGTLTLEFVAQEGYPYHRLRIGNSSAVGADITYSDIYIQDLTRGSIYDSTVSEPYVTNSDTGSDMVIHGVVRPYKETVGSSGDLDGKLPEMSSDYFDFAGWYTDKTYTTKVTADDIVPAHTYPAFSKWTVHLDYDENDGSYKSTDASVIPQDTYDLAIGSSVTVKNYVPYKVGYNFNGWLASSGDSSVSGKTYWPGDTITLNANLKLTAQWTEATTAALDTEYAISKFYPGQVYFYKYVPSGNQYVSGFTYSSGELDTNMYLYTGTDTQSAVNDTRTYTYGVTEMGEKDAMVSSALTSGTTYYYGIGLTDDANASTGTNFQLKEHTINYTLDANGGSVSVSNVTGHYNTATSVVDPTRTGYTFSGWSIQSRNYSPYTGSIPAATNSAIINESITTNTTSFVKEETLVANWDVNYYDVSVYAYYNQAASAQSKTTTYVNGNVGGTVTVDTETADASVTKSIAYETNGSRTIATISASPATGYTFAGWYLAPTFDSDGNITDWGEIYTADAAYSHTMEASAYKAYAKFEINTYAVNLAAYSNSADDPTTYAQSSAGGTVGLAADSLAETANGTYVHGQEYTMYAKPATGYAFAGWYFGDSDIDGSATIYASSCTNTDGVYSITRTIESERVYKAKFVVQQYTLTLNANGGELVNNDQSYTDYAGKTVTVNDPERTGYNFVQWNLVADDGGAANGTLEGTTYTFGGGDDRALAQWAIANYTITIDPNGGTVPSVDYYNGQGGVTGVLVHSSSFSESTEFDMAYDTQASIAEPTRTGYTFVDWTVTGQTGSFAQGAPATYRVGENDAAVITANWSINTYTLRAEAYSNTATADKNFTHSTHGGTVQIGEVGTPSATVTENINYNDTRVLIATPATGYSFAGWTKTIPTTDAALTDDLIISTNETYEIEAMPANAVTYYAVFKVNAYNVTVHAAYNTAEAKETFVEGTTGGTVTGGGLVNYGLTTPLTAEVAHGYTFEGWYTSLDSTTAVSTSATYQPQVTENTDLYAKFAIRKFTVTVTTMANSASDINSFDPVTGCGTIANAGEHDYNTSVTLTATPAEGYNFLGWYSDIDLTDLLSEEESMTVTVSKALNYYAKFEIKSSQAEVYASTVDADGNVTQDAVGGKVSLSADGTYGASASDTYLFGGVYTVYAMANAGYTFDGWYRDAALTIPADDNVAENGGYSTDGGYYYKGFTKVADSTEVVYAKFSVSKAHFEVWTYSNTGAAVGTYQNNVTGGTVTITESEYVTNVTGTGTAKVSAEVFYEKSADLVATPATGYVFGGWYSDNTFADTSLLANTTGYSAVATEEIQSYYAKFDVGQFTIFFDANGGTEGSATSGTAYYNTAFEISSSYTPTRTGWSFAGWALSDTSATGTYSQGVWVDAGTISNWYIAGNDVTLYAIWSQDSYGVSVQAAYSTLTSGGVYNIGTEGGTVELVDVTADDNGNFILPTGEAISPHLKFTPETGYTLNSWRYSYSAPSSTPSVSTWGDLGSPAVTMPNRAIYIVAFFEVGQFDVYAYAYSNSADALNTYVNNASGGTVKFGKTGTNGTYAQDRGYYTQDVLAIATASRGYAFGGWYRYNLQSVGTATEDNFLIDKVFIQEDAELTATVDDNRVTDENPYSDKLNVYFAVFNIQAYNATISARTYKVGIDEVSGGGVASIDGGTVGVGLTETADDNWVWLEAVGGNEKTLTGVYYGERVYYQATANTGYAFAGWYSVRDAEYYGEALVEEYDATYSRIMRDADTYLEAKFVPNTFTLVLDPGEGGTAGNPAEIQVTFNSSFKIESSSTPTKVGYNFLGWSDTADGAVVDAYSVTITPTIIAQWYEQCGADGTHYIYAVWEEAMIVISLDTQGGSSETNSLEISVGSKLPSITVPIYDGFVFGGYYSDMGGQGTQYYDADGNSEQYWSNNADGTIYALWLTPVLEDVSYNGSEWAYDYATEAGTITVTAEESAPVITPSGITEKAPEDAKWITSIDTVDTEHIETQKELTANINLNHYTQTALTSLLNAVTGTDTQEELEVLTQPQANAYVASMASSMNLDYDVNAKKSETVKPSVTLYENDDKLNIIKGQTILDKADSANGSTYTFPSSTEAPSYTYAGKYSYTHNGGAGGAVDYYLYTNSKTPVIALEIDDGEVTSKVSTNNSSYPTSATIVDNSSDKSYIDPSKKTYTTSAVKATEDVEKAWFSAYTAAGIGTGYDYNAKTVIYLTPEFTASGTKNEIVYTITPSDNAYVANEGVSGAELSGTTPNLQVGYTSYTYTPASTESITVCVCYHNSMNGDSDEGTDGGTGSYMQLYMDQVDKDDYKDAWYNQLHMFRTSGGASNWDFPKTTEGVYPVDDATYPYETVGCVLGSFIYVFDENMEPDAYALAAAGDYTGAKEKIISSISLKADEAKAAIADKSNDGNINGNDRDLGYAEINVWNTNVRPKQGSYIYGHLVDRWGNVFNKVWESYNIDQYASTINGSEDAASYDVFEDGGSNIDYMTLDGANVQFVLDSSTTYENGVLTTTGNTLTISTGSANTTYNLTVVDNATNTTTKKVTTDADGMLVLNVEDAQANLAEGAYTFTLNGETVNLYAGEPSIVRDVSITPISLAGDDVIVTVKTASDAVKVQLIEGNTTRTIHISSSRATVVTNEDGTLTWTIRFKAATGKHEYGVRGRTVEGWEDVKFTVSTEVVEPTVPSAVALKSVFNAEAEIGARPVIKARTLAGTQKLQVVYPAGNTITFNRSDDIVISTVDGIETWALSITPYGTAGEYQVDVIAKYDNKWQTGNAKTSTVTVTDGNDEEGAIIYSVSGGDSVKRYEYTTFNVLTNAETIKLRFNYSNTTATFTSGNATVVENADGTKMWTVKVRFWTLGEEDVNFSARTAAPGWTDGEVFGTINVVK